MEAVFEKIDLDQITGIPQEHKMLSDIAGPAEVAIRPNSGKAIQVMRKVRETARSLDEALEKFCELTGAPMEQAIELYTAAGALPSYSPKSDPDTVRGLALLGARDPHIARALKIPLVTFRIWLLRHPELQRALEEGRLVADAKVAGRLYKRAIGYDYVEVQKESDGAGNVTKTKTTTKHVPPDVQAAKMWLVNRAPEQWRECAVLPASSSAEISDEDLQQELIRAGLSPSQSRLATLRRVPLTAAAAHASRRGMVEIDVLPTEILPTPTPTPTPDFSELLE